MLTGNTESSFIEKFKDYISIATKCLTQDYIPDNIEAQIKQERCVTRQTELNKRKSDLYLSFKKDLETNQNIIHEEYGYQPHNFDLIKYEFYTEDQLVFTLDQHFASLLRQSCSLNNVCKTAFISHSSLKTLFKMQMNNSGLYRLLANSNNTLWIEQNIQNYDSITQNEVRKTGLMGKLWGVDVLQLNTLRDDEIYLIPSPELLGVHCIFSNGVENNIEDCALFKATKELMNVTSIPDEDKNKLWDLSFKINQILTNKVGNKPYYYTYNMTLIKDSFCKLEVI